MPNWKSLQYLLTRPVAAALLAAGLTAGAAVAPASAQEAPVVSTLEAFVVDAKGDDEVLAPATSADPGDVIEYRITHHNQSGGALEGFVVNGRVPDGTAYIGGSAKAAQADVFEVKIDGEDWQTLPAKKTVKDADGNERRVDAVPADFRAVRWRLSTPLGDGQTTANSYRIKVLN